MKYESLTHTYINKQMNYYVREKSLSYSTIQIEKYRGNGEHRKKSHHLSKIILLIILDKNYQWRLILVVGSTKYLVINSGENCSILCYLHCKSQHHQK